MSQTTKKNKFEKTYRLACVFAPGFERVIERIITSRIKDATDFIISSGFALFTTKEAPLSVAIKLDFCNNVFLVLNSFGTDKVNSESSCDFGFMEMIQTILSLPFPSQVDNNLQASTFRLRFSNANTFTSTDKDLTARLEKLIAHHTHTEVKRTGGGDEYWFLKRTEGFCCFALRITPLNNVARQYQKGELREELVLLLTFLPNIKQDKKLVMLDPFAGHGAIPAKLSSLFPGSTIFASDIDTNATAALARKFSGNRCVRVRNCDATSLNYLKDNSVDYIITDPPWGDFDKTCDTSTLYPIMLKEFARILTENGHICLLTGAKTEFEDAVRNSERFAPYIETENFRTDILVNGKKSAVYLL